MITVVTFRGVGLSLVRVEGLGPGIAQATCYSLETIPPP